MALNIVTKALSELREYERNSRKNDAGISRMVRCLREFGFRIPIVIRSDGTIIDGPLCFKAAKKNGAF